MPSPRLLFLVTEDWYFWAHRLLLARKARDAGYEVIVATRVSDFGERIAAEGFQLVPLAWVRGSLNPFRIALEAIGIVRLYRRLRPDIVHHVSLKPILLGSAAALFGPRQPVLNAVTGLGYTFTSDSARARVLAFLVKPILRLLLRRPAAITLLENEDDRRFVVEKIGVPAERTAVNRGSGVDICHYAELPLPDDEPVTVGCATRMLGIKGVPDLVAASRLLRARNVPHRLVLAGGADPENHDAIPEATLRRWAQEDGVEWLGAITDVRELWRRCAIAALASLGGEGVPLSLIEAAACGRPLVATDVPGSRDIAQAGVNALLVPPSAPEALAGALERLIREHDVRRTFAAASRHIVESGFSSEHVSAATLALYARLLTRGAARGA
jgi:glycosyltransferase involved in cell wall biosynthesis